MLTKTQVLENIKDLPDKFSIEELMDKIILLQKIEIGLEQSKNDQITPDNQLDEKLKKWLD